MCSITGYIERSGTAEPDVLEKMNRSLKHRGPDDNGTDILTMFGAKQNNVGIGFNRLSIRDLTQAGHQPMYSGGGNVVITFNGEIYNADQFRDELIKRGHSFNGTSDTEVLLHLYEEYGIERMLELIDGMFAICLVDIKQDCIYLIRDRIGEKPLYYYKNNNVFMWASEYKAFYEHPEFVPELAYDNLTEYFMFRYISGEETLLNDVKNLSPGTFLRIDKDGITYKRYWDFPKPEKNILKKEDAAKEFSILLEKAYQTRLVSDVEIGIQLSGGVDSSCLTDYVSRVTEHKLKTFGIVFNGKQYSEQKYMEQVIDRCGLDSNMYDFTDDQFLDLWLLTTYFFEAPMNHEGTLGLFYLNRRASEKVKVMLCGEGADETMGGYRRFWDVERYRTDFVYRAKKFLRRLIRDNKVDLPLLLRRIDLDKEFVKSTQYCSDEDVERLYPECSCDEVIEKRKRFLEGVRGTGLRKYMNYETMTYCQDLLMRADKVSMASALEVRVPYLMPELIEFENKLPDSLFVTADSKNYVMNTKKLLKERSESIFGTDFTYRPKMGFGIIMMDYLSSGHAREYIERFLLPGIKNRGLLNYDFLCELYQRNMDVNAHSNDSSAWILWTAFSFEMWAEMFLDGNPNRYYDEADIGLHR